MERRETRHYQHVTALDTFCDTNWRNVKYLGSRRNICEEFFFISDMFQV